MTIGIPKLIVRKRSGPPPRGESHGGMSPRDDVQFLSLSRVAETRPAGCAGPACANGLGRIGEDTGSLEEEEEYGLDGSHDRGSHPGSRRFSTSTAHPRAALLDTDRVAESVALVEGDRVQPPTGLTYATPRYHGGRPVRTTGSTQTSPSPRAARARSRS